MWITTVVCFLVSVPQFSLGGISISPHQHAHLINSLFKNYTKELLPVRNNTGIDVSLSFYLLSINELHETTETLSVSAVFGFEWRDEFLMWGETEDAPEAILVDQDKIWTAGIKIFNGISANQRIWEKDGHVFLFNNGTVHMTLGGVYNTHCKILVTKFPFDTQICDIVLSSPQGTVTGERLLPIDGDHMTQYHRENGEWELENITITEYYQSSQYLYDHQEVVITLVLRRLPKFHIFNSILPIIFLSLLNTSVFLMPDATGEKMGMSLSFLLSYVIFLSYINDILPYKSDTTCFFSVYMVSLFLLSSLVTLVTVLSASMYHKPSSSAPPMILRTFLLTSRTTVQQQREKLADNACNQETWQDVAKRVNKVTFWTFLILILTVHVVFFYMTIS